MNNEKTWTIDQISFTDDEQFQYYLDNLLDLEDNPKTPSDPKPNAAQSESKPKQEQQTKTMENQIKDDIVKLEATVEEKRAELKAEFSAETLKQINDSLKGITKLKDTLRYETQLREKYEKMFDGKMTKEAFADFWQTKLRSEALLADMNEKENAVRLAKKHPIYSTW